MTWPRLTVTARLMVILAGLAAFADGNDLRIVDASGRVLSARLEIGLPDGATGLSYVRDRKGG